MVSKNIFVALGLVLGLILWAGCKKKVEEAPTPAEAPAAAPEAPPPAAPVPPPPPAPPAPPVPSETMPHGTPQATPKGTPTVSPFSPEPVEDKVLDVPKEPAKTPGEVLEVAPPPAPSEPSAPQ